MKKKYLVFPEHGVCEISQANLIKNIFGKPREFVVLRAIENGISIMIPKAKLKASGVRKVMSKATARECHKVMSSRGTRRLSKSNSWATQYRTYIQNIKSNNPLKIAHIKSELEELSELRKLSFGEAQILETVSRNLFAELKMVG